MATFNLSAPWFQSSSCGPIFWASVSQRLIDLLWLYPKVQSSVESAIWPSVWKWFLSLFTDLLPFLGGVGFSPGLLTPSAGAGEFCFWNFCGWCSDEILRRKPNRKSSRSPFVFYHERQRRISHLPQIVSFFSPLHLWGFQSLHRETFVLGALREMLWAKGSVERIFT